MKAVVFPGCQFGFRYPYVERITREVCAEFGLNFTDVAEFTCCPDPVGVRSFDTSLWLSLAARNLALAEKHDSLLLTFCNGCFETLHTAAVTIQKDEKKRKSLNEQLSSSGLSLSGKIQVKHIAEVFLKEIGPEQIAQKVRYPLRGFIFAPHPGCHLVRPSDVAQFDHPLNPHFLDDLLRAIGSEPLNYPEKMNCCGLTIFYYDRDVSVSMAYDKVRAVENTDGIVVTCPSCLLHFETSQMLKKGEGKKKVPVFYYFELLALAMGKDPEYIGFSRHRIPPIDFLKKWEERRNGRQE
ncbi:MAG: CoB--CoM heterodisulfide reductase iron-sulfur subunit B family protein [bacterium JZ-2024 1]